MRWLIPTLALIAPQATAALPADPITAALDNYLEELETRGAAGVTLIAQGDRVLLRRGFGKADCADTTAMTPDHLVMMGSITKEFTQLLSYVLAEEGKLAFQDPVGNYLDGLPPKTAAITIEQLVSHTGGLPDLIDETGRPVPYTVDYDYIPVTRAQLIERAAKAELIFPPGSREEYSNLGYNLLGAILEIASGESYEQLLASRIFDKAEMTDTGYTFDDRRRRRFAEGCGPGGERWGSPWLDGMWGPAGASWNLKAAGGLLTTVDDLARWLGALGEGRFLGPEMQRRYLDERLVVSEARGQRLMGPAGSNGIFNAVAYWAESSDLRIAVVTSRSDHQAESAGIARQVIRSAFQYLGAAAEKPEPLRVGFLIVDGVYNSELMAPWDIFHHTVFHTQPGMEVFAVSPDGGPVTSFEGLEIAAHYGFDDHPEIDVLVVPSAEHSMDSDLENVAMLAWVRQVGERAEYLVSLCDGAFVLAAAGLLDGLESTTFPGDVDSYVERFPQLRVHREVSFVHDGKALTSQGGARSYDVAMYLVDHLYGEQAARGVAQGMVITWPDPDLRFIAPPE